MTNKQHQSIDNIQQAHEDLKDVYLHLLSLESEGDVEGFREYLMGLSDTLVNASVRVFSSLEESKNVELFRSCLNNYLSIMDLIGGTVERITNELVLKDKIMVDVSEMIH